MHSPKEPFTSSTEAIEKKKSQQQNNNKVYISQEFVFIPNIPPSSFTFLDGCQRSFNSTEDEPLPIQVMTDQPWLRMQVKKKKKQTAKQGWSDVKD